MFDVGTRTAALFGQGSTLPPLPTPVAGTSSPLAQCGGKNMFTETLYQCSTPLERTYSRGYCHLEGFAEFVECLHKDVVFTPTLRRGGGGRSRPYVRG